MFAMGADLDAGISSGSCCTAQLLTFPNPSSTKRSTFLAKSSTYRQSLEQSVHRQSLMLWLLQGQQAPTTREDSCVSATDSALGNILGAAFVNASFGSQALNVCVVLLVCFLPDTCAAGDHNHGQGNRECFRGHSPRCGVLRCST